VEKIIEKPPIPLSNITTVAIYIFKDKIYQVISQIPPDANNELQLTDTIRQLIDENCNVYAMELSKNEKRIEIGTPEFYWTALKEAIVP